MQNNNYEERTQIAKAMAKALEEKGIVSCQPEGPPNPRWAAYEAFIRVYPGNDKGDWDELFAPLEDPILPMIEHYRKLAEICLRAIRKYNLPEELREPITFAWGYYSALHKAEVSRLKAGPGTSTN